MWTLTTSHGEQRRRRRRTIDYQAQSYLRTVVLTKFRLTSYDGDEVLI